jgi:hypothetical protein
MDELKQLVEMVASLPEMALWVCGMFLAYKLSILASVYATIRFVVDRVGLVIEHVTGREKVVRNSVELRAAGTGVHFLGATEGQIVDLLKSLANDRGFVHEEHVDRLHRALTNMKEEEKK